MTNKRVRLTIKTIRAFIVQGHYAALAQIRFHDGRLDGQMPGRSFDSGAEIHGAVCETAKARGNALRAKAVLGSLKGHESDDHQSHTCR